MSQLRATRVLIADLIGLSLDASGEPDPSEAQAFIEAQPGCRFHTCPASAEGGAPDPARVDFHYCPELSTREDLLAAADGRYDALIAAATPIPAGARFNLGGVRIGAGTGNMGSTSWGGGEGRGGVAPLMNTPGLNARATAQMAWKALMHHLPNLPFAVLHARVAASDFDTGRDLRHYPTRKIEGQRLAVVGYGNIGREVALLGRAFGMTVVVYARPHHREVIEAEGFLYAATVADAAKGADALSIHVGLGQIDPTRGVPSNVGLIGTEALLALAPGAILINFDRGELVDTAALDVALEAGTVRHAVIDADIFTDPTTGTASGPMVPYLALLPKHEGRLTLLPHAAADTDHPTRVAGAKQAVTQILTAIRQRRVINLKGDLPAGYSAA